MGLFDALDVSGSGLSAERLRMDVTAENLANAQTTPGRERTARTSARRSCCRRSAAAASARRWPARWARARRARRSGGVQVAGIVEDQTPAKQVYDPGHPDADAQGYVSMPNVDPVTEMVDLITASRCLRGRRDRHADREVDVLEDAGAAALMAIPIDPALSTASGRSGSSSLPSRRATGQQSGGQSFGGALSQAISSLDGDQSQAAGAAQSLVDGSATDASSVVMSVERARLDDAAGLPDPHQGRRGLHRRLPHPGLDADDPSEHQHQGQDRRWPWPPSPWCSWPCMLMKVASSPSYATVATGVDPAQTGKMTTALDQKGIKCEASEQRHGDRRGLVADGAGPRRARLVGHPGQRRRRLLPVRQAEARRQQLPAAGHLPARAGG